jgi:serine/threonine-protein kinase RsbW
VATITLRVPAHPDYVGLIRSTAGHVAARADLTVEQIDDLRLAVDEAFALLISHNPSHGDVSVTFEVAVDVLTINLVGPEGSPELDRSTFAWTVLQALVADVKISTSGSGACTLHLITKVVASA